MMVKWINVGPHSECMYVSVVTRVGVEIGDIAAAVVRNLPPRSLSQRGPAHSVEVDAPRSVASTRHIFPRSEEIHHLSHGPEIPIQLKAKAMDRVRCLEDLFPH